MQHVKIVECIIPEGRVIAKTLTLEELTLNCQKDNGINTESGNPFFCEVRDRLNIRTPEGTTLSELMPV